MLEVKNVSFSFDTHEVFKDFSLYVDPYDIICIIGKNGSGKTTLLKILSSLILVEEGSFILSGRSITQEKLKDDISYIPDIPELYENLNIEETIELFRIIFKQEKIYTEKVKANLQSLSFDLTNEQTVGTFSLGMKYKVYFSMMLALERKILLLDEPLNALDIQSRLRATQMIQEHVKKHQGICIFSSHVEDTIDHLATRRIYLEEEK